MKVEDVMNDEVIIIQENEQVNHARNLMLKHGFSRVIVVDRDENPIGIVTEKDLTRKLRGNGPTWKRRPIDTIAIRRVMSNGLITVDVDDDLREAVEIMIQNKISSVPVVDDEGLAGIVTKTDLMNFYASKFQNRWKVSNLMTKDVVTVNENHTITHVINVMEENNIDGVVVMFDGEIAGIITPANISFAQVEHPETGVSVERVYFIRQGVEGGDKRKAREISMLTAGDIMNEDFVKISPDEDAVEAAKLMYNSEISHIPVVEDDNLVGIITKTDIIKGIQ
ncbi:MAG: CBS domain-containing protein [Methanobacterium sp.]|nr:CBS domain-containing protein [Methanobacterium sp.]